MQTGNQTAEQTQRILIVLWIVIFASQFMLLAVLFFTKPKVFEFDFSQPVLGENAVIVLAFAIIAVVNLLVSFFLARKYKDYAVENQSIGAIQTGMLIGCAMCEAISLFGFVLALAFDYQYFFLWFIAGILGMLIHFPRRKYVHDASYKSLRKS